jgi:hypothetical protein
MRKPGTKRARQPNGRAQGILLPESALCRGAIWRERFYVVIVRLQVASTCNQEVFTVNAKILCVEADAAVLESRCAVLKYSGYDAASASPRLAESVLRTQKIDLIILSRLRDSDLHRIVSLSDGAEVLVLDGLTMPSELLSLVAQRLNRHQWISKPS